VKQFLDSDGLRQCSSCGAVKPVSDFYRVASGASRLQRRCKLCSGKVTKAWRKRNPEKIAQHRAKWRAQYPDKTAQALKAWKQQNPGKLGEYVRKRRLKHNFGLTVEDYDRLLHLQGGVCAGCGSPPSDRRRLSVDHDHTTGCVRGLLCTNCNRALGLIYDNPRTLSNLAKYLEKGRIKGV
jgi:hypothetical protein